jgi:hypothetical protein
MADLDIDVSAGRLSEDGSVLRIINVDGQFLRIPLDPARWAEHLCRLLGRDVTADERRAMPLGSVTGAVCVPGSGTV